MQPTFLNAQQVCVRFNLSRSSLYKLCRRGELPRPRHFGKAARWSVADLEAVERAVRSSNAPTLEDQPLPPASSIE
jgi:predicted DNA-binding transcriptional regulator AlpA